MNHAKTAIGLLLILTGIAFAANHLVVLQHGFEAGMTIFCGGIITLGYNMIDGAALSTWAAPVKTLLPEKWRGAP